MLCAGVKAEWRKHVGEHFNHLARQREGIIEEGHLISNTQTFDLHARKMNV